MNRSDATSVFEAPDGPPARVRRRSMSPVTTGDRSGRVDLWSFASTYRPVHPDVRPEWERFERNARVRAQHWRHDAGPRPTIIVCHGFLASPYALNGAFLSMPWFFSHGHDVLLVSLPFHNRRSDPWWAYPGAGLFAEGITTISEGILQAVHDVRAVIAQLRSDGVPRIGVTGLSLGGYITSALATVEPDLGFVIPNCAVVDLASLIDGWTPFNAALRSNYPLEARDDLDRALRAHSPLRFPAVVAHDRRFVIHGSGDRLSPPDQGRALWEHWQYPRAHWFPGNHLFHFGQRSYLREMGRFIGTTGFGEPTQP